MSLKKKKKIQLTVTILVYLEQKLSLKSISHQILIPIGNNNNVGWYKLITKIRFELEKKKKLNYVEARFKKKKK